jgi:V-type H+-transporting ATPase subunit a
MQYQLNILKNDIYEKFQFLAQAENSICEFIKYRGGDTSLDIQEPGQYDLYRKYFKKEKLIFSNLNKCHLTEYLINGEVWIPIEKYDALKNSLNLYAETDPNLLAVTFEDYTPAGLNTSNMSISPMPSRVPTKTHNTNINSQQVHDTENKILQEVMHPVETQKTQPTPTPHATHPSEILRTPPTYFKTNDLIFPFQLIVDTYGVPRYREINPALFAIVSFPFLFGVMFGDIGHGFLLFLFSSYLFLNKDELTASKSALAPVLKARYLLLFMGFCALYCGFIYNDFLSIPLNLFGTCYVNQGEIAVRENKNCVYPFGIDPKWYVATNELAFFNSAKMKFSVIIGVLQMIFGIGLKGLNAVYFKDTLGFIFEFIPQIIFMTAFFGYMILMIFIKWSVNWEDDSSKAPSIITLLINIFLKKGSVDGKPLFIGTEFQETLHNYLLIVCLICIPLILIPKPILLYKKQQKEQNHGVKSEHGDESLANLFVHQSIETIEFVLGSISNTASYLRLWALSLAHAQLAKVFFEKAVIGMVQSGSLFMVILGFFIFANVTFAVLMCMDLMECFLHTLRLHWVEFQNKFYKADGIKFQPFSFKYVIEE